MSHLAPLVAPPSIVIWIFAILLLPHLSLQEEGHLHPTELSPLTESPESATWAAVEREEGDVGGREVETRTWSQECGEGPLRYKLVQFTAHHHNFPASNVLILGEQDGPLDNSTPGGKQNYWLAEYGKTTGQDITVRVDYCSRLIAGLQIKNTRNPYRATDEFKVSASLNKTGPWETVVDSHLPATTEGQAAPLFNFTFEEPMKLKYLKFELISYWGVGGGLQYFAAIPASDCNVTAWTEWSGCCNKERRRTRTAVRGDLCKAVSEGERCTEDNCSADSAIATTGGEVAGQDEYNATLLNVVIGLATLSGVLLLLLVGVTYLIYKMWSTARNAIKRDVNPLYGIDYEGEEAETEDPRPHSVDNQYDYMG